VNATAYGGQLVIHSGHARLPLLLYAGKFYEPLFSLDWRESGDACTVARLVSSAVVAQFSLREQKSPACALLMTIGLLPLAMQLGKRLILRIICGSGVAKTRSGLTLALPYMAYLRNLSAVTTFVVATISVPKKDKSAMSMVRLFGYAAASKRYFSVVAFRDETEFDTMCFSKQYLNCPPLERTGFDTLLRQWKALNSMYPGSHVAELSLMCLCNLLPIVGARNVDPSFESLNHVPRLEMLGLPYNISMSRSNRRFEINESVHLETVNEDDE
jgi:hypothetical protein